MGYCPKCNQWQSDNEENCPRCKVILVNSICFEKAKRNNIELLPVEPDFLFKSRKRNNTFRAIGILLLSATIFTAIMFVFIYPIRTILASIVTLSAEYLFYYSSDISYRNSYDASQFVYDFSSESKLFNTASTKGKIGAILIVSAIIMFVLLADYLILGLALCGDKKFEYNDCLNIFLILFLINISILVTGIYLSKDEKTAKPKEILENISPRFDWNNARIRCPYCNSYYVNFIDISSMKIYGKRWTCSNCKRNF